METFKYEVGASFQMQNFKVTVTDGKYKCFIQSRLYDRETGTITERRIDDEGCEAYEVRMEDGFMLSVGKYFLDDCKLFARNL